MVGVSRGRLVQPRLEYEVAAYMRHREARQAPDLLCWFGCSAMAWLFMLAAGKAVLQMWGLW
jgi:hypothetical protein